MQNSSTKYSQINFNNTLKIYIITQGVYSRDGLDINANKVKVASIKEKTIVLMLKTHCWFITKSLNKIWIEGTCKELYSVNLESNGSEKLNLSLRFCIKGFSSEQLRSQFRKKNQNYDYLQNLDQILKIQLETNWQAIKSIYQNTMYSPIQTSVKKKKLKKQSHLILRPEW